MPRFLSLSLALAVAAGTWPHFSVGVAPPRPAPSWKNISWLNSEGPLTLESLRGRVVLLNFGVFTCINCTNTVPSLVDFDRKYRSRGLTLDDASYREWSRRIEALLRE